MADNDTKELWEKGESSLFKARLERRKADTARRKAGRKALKAEEVKMEWEPQNGVWFGSLCTQELGFDNRIIEVDCPGLTSPALHTFEWKRLPRPTYPLDEATTWVAPAA